MGTDQFKIFCVYNSKETQLAGCWHDDGVNKENLHSIDNQSRQVVFSLFFMVYSKQNKKHVLCVSIKLEKHSSLKVWENLKKP